MEDWYQDLEVWYPLLRLREAGHQAMVIGTGKPAYQSKHGYEIKPDVEAKQVRAAELDGLIIPGGYAPDILRRFPEVVQLVRDVFTQGKVVGSICHGQWMLCSADVLKGKTATCFFAIKDDVVHAGAKYVDQEVVVDGNLITSRKPEDLPAFMREILKALSRVSLRA